MLSTTEVGPRGQHAVFGGNEEITDFVKARVGNGLLPEGSSGALRRLPYEIDKLKTLSVVAVERATGKPVDRREMSGNGAWIDYAGPPGPPLRLVLQGRQAHVQAGHVPEPDVVIGGSAPSAPGSPPDLVAGAAGWRARRPRERDRHVDARLPLDASSGTADLADRLALALLPILLGICAAPVRGARARAGDRRASTWCLAQVAFGRGLILPS